MSCPRTQHNVLAWTRTETARSGVKRTKHIAMASTIIVCIVINNYSVCLGGFLYSLGGYDGNSYLNTVECYNSHTKQWSHVAPMHYSRSCFATAVCDGYLYALGGYGPSYLRTVERYDPASNSWEMMPAMSTYRINFGVGVLNGCLYVVGEQNNVPHLAC